MTATSAPARRTARGGRAPARRTARLDIFSLRARRLPSLLLQPDKKPRARGRARDTARPAPRPSLRVLVPRRAALLRVALRRHARAPPAMAAAASAAALARHHSLLPAPPPSPARSAASVCCALRPRRRLVAAGRRRRGRGSFRPPRAGMDMDLASGAVEVINDLGFDTLTFLGVTVLVIPAFRVVRASPVKYLSPVPPRLFASSPCSPRAHTSKPKCRRRFSASSAPASCSTSSASSGTSPTSSSCPSGGSFSW